MGDTKMNSLHLTATAKVLQDEAPELLHHIRAIGFQEPDSSSLRIKGATFQNYIVDIRCEDAKAILEVLEKTKANRGWKHEIFGCRLILLTDLWKNLIANLPKKKSE